MSANYIPGIYNYCDRWCERCTFTSRCRNFEGTSQLSEDQLDVNNQAFWDNIASNFENALKMLHEMAEEQGIDLSSISEEEHEAYRAQKEKKDKTIKEHELSLLCKEYQKKVRPFLNKETNELLVDTARQMTSELHMGIRSEEEVVHTMADLGDCSEIIHWYLFFIDAKLQRALSGKFETDLQSDSNGSAKIAIIAIERSMGAWKRWLELMPSSEDIALQALSLLSRLKQKALSAFPNALRFVRPGFDEQ